MVHTIRTGTTGRAPPARHGPWQTVHDRFRRRAPEGVFAHALRQFQTQSAPPHHGPRLGSGRAASWATDAWRG